MFGASARSQFKKGVKKGVGESDLGYMLSNLRDIYTEDLKKSYENLREFYRRAGAKDNVSKVNIYLDNLRSAVKAVSSIFAGNADKTNVTKAFNMIGIVESNIDTILDNAKSDKVLAEYLNKLESRGFNFYNFKQAHVSFRQILEKGKFGEDSIVKKLKETSPEAYGIGGHILDQAAIGILGPAAIPLKFLGKAAMGAIKRSKAKSVAKEQGRFDRGLGIESTADWREGERSKGVGLGSIFSSSLYKDSSTAERSGRIGRPADAPTTKRRKAFQRKEREKQHLVQNRQILSCRSQR